MRGKQLRISSIVFHPQRRVRHVGRFVLTTLFACGTDRNNTDVTTQIRVTQQTWHNFFLDLRKLHFPVFSTGSPLTQNVSEKDAIYDNK